jgi:hypothetical protein
MNYGMSYPVQSYRPPAMSHLGQIGADNQATIQVGRNAWIDQNSTGGWGSRIDSFGKNVIGNQTGGHNLFANGLNGGNNIWNQSNANQGFINQHGGNWLANQSNMHFGQGNFYGGTGSYNTDYVNHSNGFMYGVNNFQANQNRGYYATTVANGSNGSINHIGNQYSSVFNTNGNVSANQHSGYANYAMNTHGNGQYNQSGNFNNLGNWGGNVQGFQKGFASTAYNNGGNMMLDQMGGAFATAVNGKDSYAAVNQGNIYNQSFNSGHGWFNQDGYKNDLVAFPGAYTESRQNGTVNNVWNYGQEFNGIQHGNRNTALI